jgi:hypothetical protein
MVVSRLARRPEPARATTATRKEPAMPSWIEKLGWSVRCPTCAALPTEPCRSLYHRAATLEFNHPARNRLFHLEQQQRRAAGRQPVDSLRD